MYTVILLEDDEWMLKGIQASFNWKQYNMEVVKTFYDPCDLIEYIDKHDVDVIFTDIKMPKMSGLELVKKIKFEMGRENILFVIISAYDSYNYMRESIHLGVLDYCKKPIERSETDAILQNLEMKLRLQNGDTDDEVMSNKNFQELLNYISRNYNKKLTLKDLARMFYFNSNYLCLLFNKKLGMKFSEYLRKIRMEEAKRLFDTKSMTVSEVSFRVGFSDYSYFHKVFTNFYGITPNAYKKKVEKKLKDKKDNFD